MNTPQIIAIAAIGKKTRYICHDDDLLWRIPADLQRVKKITLGHPLIMGRKTYASIGKPLPNRSNIIITRNKEYKHDEGCLVAHSLNEALELAKNEPGGEEIYIFGGAEIYALALSVTNRLLLTLVDSDIPGTAKFPEFENDFTAVDRIGGGTFDGANFEWVGYARNS